MSYTKHLKLSSTSFNFKMYALYILVNARNLITLKPIATILLYMQGTIQIINIQE